MTHAGLTEQEIAALPDETRVYESVGRMFILSNKYVFFTQ
jgi:chaperonin cofactor prefoldin